MHPPTGATNAPVSLPGMDVAFVHGDEDTLVCHYAEAVSEGAAEIYAALVALPPATSIVTVGGLQGCLRVLCRLLSPEEARTLWQLALSNRHIDISLNWAISNGFSTPLESYMVAGDSADIACVKRIYATAVDTGFLVRHTAVGKEQRWALPAGILTGAYAFHGAAECRRLLGAHPPDQSWMLTPYKIEDEFVL